MNANEITDLFRYHAPTDDMVAKFDAVRRAVTNAAIQIDEVCPPGPDRTAAIRKLKEAQMTANAAIVLDGKAYR